MATDLMKDWIVELYNPERRQTKGYLGTMDEHGQKANCCLGVLCEVKGIEGEVYEELSYGDPAKSLSYDGVTGLPRAHVIRDVLGVEGGDPASGTDTLELYEREENDWDGFPVTTTYNADEANDDHDLTFTEIAEKLSERYLSGEEQFEVRKRVEDKGWA